MIQWIWYILGSLNVLDCRSIDVTYKQFFISKSRDWYNNVYFTSSCFPSLSKFWFISTFSSLVQTVDRQTSKTTLNFWSWKMKTTIIVKVYQDATNTADYSIDHRWTRKYFLLSYWPRCRVNLYTSIFSWESRAGWIL